MNSTYTKDINSKISIMDIEEAYKKLKPEDKILEKILMRSDYFQIVKEAKEESTISPILGVPVIVVPWLTVPFRFIYKEKNA